MGGAASMLPSEELPESIDQTTAQSLLGEHFDDALFDAALASARRPVAAKPSTRPRESPRVSREPSTTRDARRRTAS